MVFGHTYPDSIETPIRVQACPTQGFLLRLETRSNAWSIFINRSFLCQSYIWLQRTLSQSAVSIHDTLTWRILGRDTPKGPHLPLPGLEILLLLVHAESSCLSDESRERHLRSAREIRATEPAKGEPNALTRLLNRVLKSHELEQICLPVSRPPKGCCGCSLQTPCRRSYRAYRNHALRRQNSFAGKHNAGKARDPNCHNHTPLNTQDLSCRSRDLSFTIGPIMV
eukprot:9005120-Pyramimonas_sp.AAC.1